MSDSLSRSQTITQVTQTLTHTQQAPGVQASLDVSALPQKTTIDAPTHFPQPPTTAMPPKRKNPGPEKVPSSKRVRIASPTPPTRTRSPELQDSIAVYRQSSRELTPGKLVGDMGVSEIATPVVPVKRGPGRPRKNPLATPNPVTPRVKKPRKNVEATPVSTTRKRRSAQQGAEAQKVDARVNAEGQQVQAGAGDSDLPPPVPASTSTSTSKDVFDLPSSADELSAAASQHVSNLSNPTPKRRNITRKPRITYKSRRSSLLSRGDPSGSEEEEEQEEGHLTSIHVTKSSPIIVAKKTVPVPSTPATTIKPRGRPPRARKKSAPEVPESVDIAPVAVMEVTPSAGVRTRGGRLSYGSLHETDAEGEDDVDVGIMDDDVTGGDRGFQATIIQAYKERVSRRRSLPAPAKQSVALDGMTDPFAIPEGRSIDTAKQNGVAAVDGDVVQEKISQKAMKTLKKRIMPKLMGRKRSKLVGVTEEESHVRKLLEQTILAGEGNSMLIIGARGSGKTTLVETAISDLKKEHSSEFLVIRLNGFFQTDDRIALREIWRQLGVEMDLDEKDQLKKNFADTLYSILALLSHPDELRDPDEEEADEAPKTALSVIFLIEEFDLFTTHPRQTLLYNLFDIAQSRKAPIAVIGTTTRIDVVETLEKRVKSRFSHRTVHLRNPATLGSFWDVCKSSLAVDMDEVDGEMHVPDEEREVFEKWNMHLEMLYRNDEQFQRLLKRVFAMSKDVKAFYNACIIPVSSLTTTMVFPNGSGFAAASSSLAEPDSVLSILDGLTDLELTLLIAAARLDAISDTDTCNFSMAYDEYANLTGSVKVTSAAMGITAGRLWGKEVAMGAWEKLGEYGLLTPAVVGVGGVGGRQGGMGREGRMWRVEVGLAEVGKCLEGGKAGGGRGGLGKWCKEV